MDCDPYTPSSPRSSFSSLSYSTSATPSPEPEPGPNQRSSCLRYKGVVTQPNGRWGAQLYQDNKRIWIGTFDHQDMAAQAYDLVAIRFRGPQAITNFPMCQYTRHQLDFLAHHSEVRVINMLRNQTFEDELARFVQAKNTSNNAATCVMNHVNDVMYMNSSSRERLFEKVLTPSDVGKLHRLVIPKHYAESYLPEIIGNKADACGGMMLSFEDVTRDKMWRFRYCYWKSSQNYVLTKGWGEFVKDKGLQPGDSVIFYRCIVGDNSIDRKFFIDTNIKVNNNNNNNDDNKVVKEISGVGSNQSDGEVAFNSKGFRLFGVDICPLIQLDIGEVVQSNGHVN